MQAVRQRAEASWYVKAWAFKSLEYDQPFSREVPGADRKMCRYSL